MNRMIRALALVLLLAPGGCTEFVARLAIDASDLHTAARDYALENKAQRIFIRSECRKSVNIQIEEARADGGGGEEAVQQILRDHYPPLVTMGILDKAIDDNVTGILSVPPSCGVQMDLGEFIQ